MRETMFRGKHTDSGEWKYGDLLHATYSGETLYWITEAKPGTCFGHVSYAVEPSTVGQFTGLRDAAGTRIFEGDIVAGYYQNKGITEPMGFQVVYHDAGFCTKYPGNAHPFYHVLECEDCKYCAVIGNIYDTPELCPNAAP